MNSDCCGRGHILERCEIFSLVTTLKVKDAHRVLLFRSSTDPTERLLYSGCLRLWTALTSIINTVRTRSYIYSAVCVSQSYSMAVYLVKQQSSTALLQRLRAKGIRNPDHSRALSKKTQPLFSMNPHAAMLKFNPRASRIV